MYPVWHPSPLFVFQSHLEFGVSETWVRHFCSRFSPLCFLLSLGVLRVPVYASESHVTQSECKLQTSGSL